MPNILVVGTDIGAARPMNRVVEKLLAKASVNSIFRSRIGTRIANVPGIVFCGMSSFEDLAKLEIGACEMAIAAKIPLALFADTEATVARPHFAHIRDGVKMIFVVNERAGDTARQLFRNAEVVVSGNPMWADYFRPKFGRNEIRGMLGLDRDTLMLLVPSGKDMETNRLHFAGVNRAIEYIDRLRKIVIVVSLHPALAPEDAADYRSNFKSCLAVITHQNDEKYQLSGDDLVAGADVVIPSASTIGVAAGCQRIPVVNYFTGPALDRLEKSTGSRKWPPADEDKTELRVTDDPRELGKTIEDLIARRISLIPAQERIYPKPTDPRVTPADIIAGKLLTLVAS